MLAMYRFQVDVMVLLYSLSSFDVHCSVLYDESLDLDRVIRTGLSVVLLRGAGIRVPLGPRCAWMIGVEQENMAISSWCETIPDPTTLAEQPSISDDRRPQ